MTIRDRVKELRWVPMMKKRLTPAQKQRRRFNYQVWLFNDETRKFFNECLGDPLRKRLDVSPPGEIPPDPPFKGGLMEDPVGTLGPRPHPVSTAELPVRILGAVGGCAYRAKPPSGGDWPPIAHTQPVLHPCGGCNDVAGKRRTPYRVPASSPAMPNDSQELVHGRGNC